MSKTKLFKYSAQTLTFLEVRWGRSRFILTGLLLGGILVGSLVMMNQRYGDVLGIGFFQQTALVNENRILQNQLQFLSHKLESIQKQLTLLGDRGNEIRLSADLPKLDEDLMKAGTGGTEERIDFTSSVSVNTLLNNLRSATEQAEREVHLQAASYEQVKVAYDQNKVRFSHLPAIKPMDGYYFMHDFGMRFHPILHIFRKHEGMDIINEVGTPVYATADGVVEFAGHQGGYGIAVQINHGYSLKTLYGHLSKILVNDGQQIKRGQLIARSGNTGLSNGPHLHYEVRMNGIAQNPADYFIDDVRASDLQNK